MKTFPRLPAMRLEKLQLATCRVAMPSRVLSLDRAELYMVQSKVPMPSRALSKSRVELFMVQSRVPSRV